MILTAALASLLGWATLAVLESRTKRARSIWTGVALTVTVLSLTGPLTATGSAVAKTTLALLHLVVAGVLISILRASSRRS